MISVLRLGHRLPRDERITTHVCLVARAFGAHEVIYTGQHDSSLESSVSGVVMKWGGNFSIRYIKNYKEIIKEYKKNGFVVVHLTMYGMPAPEVLSSWPLKKKHGTEERKLKTENRKLETENRKLIVVVGGEQVPKDVYELADFNVAVTSQPHSEVAALAVFLDHVRHSDSLERVFDENFKGKIKIIPSERKKLVFMPSN